MVPQKINPSNTSKIQKKVRRRTSVIEISVIIVNFNVKEFLEQSLVSVQKALKKIRSEIIVIDNASTDGSIEFLKKRFPKVKLIENKKNLGFARSSNLGMKQAKGACLAILNPDTIVQEDTFSNMLKFFKENPDTGMLGCKILNPDGTLQLACRRSFPTPWVAFTKLSGLSHLFSKSKLFGKYNLTYLDPDLSYEVEAISGSFMMIQKQVLDDVGYLDEEFFLYGEDLDWCYRIREGGWKVRYFPGTKIIHFKGESSKKAQFDNITFFYKAMALFARKHFKRKYLLMPYWILWVGVWLRAGVSIFRKMLPLIGIPLTDFVLLSSSLAAGVYLRFGNFNNLSSFVPVIIVYSLLWILLLKFFKCYDSQKFSFSNSAMAIITGFLLNTSLTFFFKQYAFSRAVILIGSLLSLIVVPGWRLLLKFLPRTGLLPFKGTLGKTLLARNTLIVGDLDSSKKLVKKLNSQVESSYNITGLVCTNGKLDDVISGVNILGSLDELGSIIDQNNIQEVIFSTKQLSYNQILTIISKSKKQKLNFKLIPDNFDVIIGKASIDRIGDVPLLEIDYNLHQTRYRVIKRGFDIVLAFCILALFSPWLLFKKYLIGAQLHRRTIYGFQNKEIEFAEFANGKLRLFNKLPYLWNILKGDLSFVGSEIVEKNKMAGSKVLLTSDIKPGLTGLMQVNSHKNLTKKDKENYHLYYMKNYSPLLDLEIMFRALFKI